MFIPSKIDSESQKNLIEIAQGILSHFPLSETRGKDDIATIIKEMETLKGCSEILHLENLTEICNDVMHSLEIALKGNLPPHIVTEGIFQHLTAALVIIKSQKVSDALPQTPQGRATAPSGVSAALTTAPAGPKTQTPPLPPAAAPAPRPAPAQQLTPALQPAPVYQASAAQQSAPSNQAAIADQPPSAQPPAPMHQPAPVNQVPNMQIARSPETSKPVATKPGPQTPEASKNEPARSLTEDANDTIRVNVGLLSSLMNLVGELVLTKNQLQQATDQQPHDELVRVSQRLGVLTSELQNEVMKTRMQPVGNALTKFQRLVRDTAKELGKGIELSLEGTDTELDRNLIEAVKDPLTHIVRNAMDHGLETPEERRVKGKKESGKIVIRSFQESGQIVIEVTDDGRGMNVDRIKKKAIEKKLVNPETLDRMSEREILNFIFLPGFSTAEVVSDLSGRGVGMDVVKTNIERIGGTIELSSRLGYGTSIRLRIPLTLAIVPALIIRTLGQNFAIPQSKLQELLRVEASGSGNQGVEMVQGVPVYRLRGAILPLVTLSQILRREDTFAIDPKAQNLALQSCNIAVLNAEGFSFGLIVDSIVDTVDIVVKALPDFLKDIKIISGAAILGDSAIAYTLDVKGLADQAGFVDKKSTQSQSLFQSETPLAPVEIEYLAVNISVAGKFILPLCMVSRLEEFDPKDFRWVGDRKIISYRDKALPLIDVRQVLKLPEQASATKASVDQRQAVVVVKLGDRDFGLEVHAILDLFMSAADLDTNTKDRAGIMGNLVSDKEIIVLLDPFEIISSYLGTQRKANALSARDSVRGPSKGRILLVDDGGFFRKHLEQLLNREGWEVQKANNGAVAFKILESGSSSAFVAIVSDIEMPTMDGLELARAVRGNPTLATLPMLGLTASYTDPMRRKALESGFDQLMSKTELDGLQEQLASIVNKRKDLANAA